MTGLGGMATPLHHDQPQRARINREEHAESSKSSGIKKKSTSPTQHDENPDSSHRRSAQQLPPRPVHHRQPQQHLRQRRPESSSPHDLLGENPRPTVSSSQSDHPHAKSSLEECRPSYLGLPYTDSSPEAYIQYARRFPEESRPSYPDHAHGGSIPEGGRYPGLFHPVVSMRNNQIYSDNNEEVLPPLQSHPPELQSSGTVNPIDSCVRNAKEGERFQALQSLATPNSYPLDYKAAVLREVPVSHTLKHHQHGNHDNYFGCSEDDKQKSQSKSVGNTLFEQQQRVIVDSSETRHVNAGDNFHAVAEHIEQTESCHIVELLAHENQAERNAEVDCMASEKSLQTESHFQQLHRELSESSSDDSFCHISKEAVERDYQNDCHLATPFEHQAQSQLLVYDYSRAGVTLVDDSSNEQQSDNLCNTEKGALIDEKGIDNHDCEIANDDQRGHNSQQDVESPPLFLGFNQSSTRFACGTSKGFRVYDINTMRECFSCIMGGVGLVELLLNTDSLLLVGGGPNPSFPLNSVVMWDAVKGKSIAQLSHKFPILAVKARQDRLVVVLENEVYVYNLSNARLLFQVHTISNIKGLCALSMKEGPSVLASPGLKKGEVRIEHIGTNGKQGDLPTRNSIDVSAHDSGLACVALNSTGSLLATASDRGTLVRIFSTKDGAPLQELRRGTDRAEIYSIAFSSSSDWLAVSSDKGTVHVFGVRTIGTDTHGEASSIRNPGSTLSFIKGVLPKYFRSEWSYAQFKLPEEMKSVVAFGQEKHNIFVLGTDGSFYKFSFDSEHGGDMKQLEFWNFLKPREQKLD